MEDIRNYRMVVVSGPDDEDGAIRFFGPNEEYRHHLECLKDYLYTYYNDLAKQIGADDLCDNLDLVIYLNALGDIVYLNSPGYGLLFIPKQVSEKQMNSLYSLFSSSEKMPIYIDYNLVRKHGEIVAEETMNYNEALENTEMLDKFFEKKPFIKRKTLIIKTR